MKPCNKIAFFLINTLFFILSAAASAEDRDATALIIEIDRSSSMLKVRSATGNTRYFDAIEKAKNDLIKTYLQSRGLKLDVHVSTFNQSIKTPEGFGAWDKALLTLEQLQNITNLYLLRVIQAR